MPNILDLSARLSADVRPFVNSMASGANASQTTFQNIAQAATMYLGARGLLGTLNRANQASMEFGQSLADASAISTLSVKEIGDALMSLDNVFGRVSKASQSMYRILSSGFSQLDASQLVQFQKAVGISAKVIRADLYNTADVMTTIANAYQLNIKEIEKLQDWFYITVREGKAQGQDLARTLGLVINSASEAGVSLNELGAAIAVLSRTQSVSQSMIGLNQMLNAFIKPTLQAQAAARKWGIEISATALQEKGLTNILTELNQKVGGNVEALEKMFGNIRAGRAILSLTGKQFHNYLNVVDMYNHEAGAGMEAFEKQIDTVQNAYERLQAQQEKTLITVGDDWGNIRKAIYNTGEVLLKAFSDTSPIARWGVYLTGINLATKNIIAVINNLRDSVNSVTRSVDRMTASFTRASAASSGLGSGAIRADIAKLRKKAAHANLALTGDFKPLLERNDQILRGATPWFNLKNQHGIAQKNNPYSVIAQNTLSPYVREHQVIAHNIARNFMKQYFVKYEDITDPVTGRVVDWKVKNAETGFKYKATHNQLEKQLTKSVFIQNEKSMNVLRQYINSARQTKISAESAEKRLINESNMRVGNFYAQPHGFRRGTSNRLYKNQSSLDRLADMKQARFAKSHRIMNWMGMNPYDRGSGIGRWWMQHSMGRSFQYRGKTLVQEPHWFFKAGNKIGSGIGKELGKFTGSIGKTMGVAFNAVATVGLMKFAWDFGKKIGESIGESLNLKDTEFFQWLGRAVTTGDWMGLGPSTAQVETRNIRSNAQARNNTFNKLIDDMRKAKISPDKILTYQEQMAEQYIKAMGKDLKSAQEATEAMNAIIDNIVQDLKDYRETVNAHTQLEEAYRALRPVDREKELNTAEKSYIRSYMSREGMAMNGVTRGLFEEFMKNPQGFTKAFSKFNAFEYNEAGLKQYFDELGIDASNIALNNRLLLNEGIKEVLSVSNLMRQDKAVQQANQQVQRNKVINASGRAASNALSAFNKALDRRSKDVEYNDVQSEYFDNLAELDNRTGLGSARLNKAIEQENEARNTLEFLTARRTQAESEMYKDIERQRKEKGSLSQAELTLIQNRWRDEAFISMDKQIIEAQKSVIKASTTTQNERDRQKKNRVKEISDVLEHQLETSAVGSLSMLYERAQSQLKKNLGDYKLKTTPEEARDAEKALQNIYIKGMKSRFENLGQSMSGISVEQASGAISRKTAIAQQKEIIGAQWRLYAEALRGLDPTRDMEAIREFRQAADSAAESWNRLAVSEMALSIENITKGLDTVELARAQHRMTDRTANKRQMAIYRNMRKEIVKQMRNYAEGSEQYETHRRQLHDVDMNIARLKDAIQNDVNEARQGLLSAFSDVISSNLQGDRLSNYGLYHATNLLARLAPALNIQQKGVSLSAVLANANARYSGSTPDTSRAMRQQQRLSTIMDSYIASKQYQDAGIGKNVQTIVTIMGKRTPLFLN
jgi:TP901 family phage tail tape measure protein